MCKNYDHLIARESEPLDIWIVHTNDLGEKYFVKIINLNCPILSELFSGKSSN